MPSVTEKIIAYNENTSPELKQLKWKALAESPFRFYRGTCHLFAADFKDGYGYKSKLRTWVCGDLHFENFGSFKGQNRLVYFDINDFDESLILSPEPEIARFLTSFIIAANQMKAPSKQINTLLQQLTGIYCETLTAGKALMMEKEVSHGMLKKYFKGLETRNREVFTNQRTLIKGKKRILKVDGAKYLALTSDKKKIIYAALKNNLKNNKRFSNLEYIDAAFRIAGTGSLGSQRYCVLCYSKENKKYYFIDIKEERRSCYAEVARVKQINFKTDASRVIYATQLMQFCSPDFLTVLQINKRWYTVKELQPYSDKLALEDFANDYASFFEVAREMMPLLAYAQIRSSGHDKTSTADELKRFADKRGWQKDIMDVSLKLAEKNFLYYDKFVNNMPKQSKRAAH
jgi:uncharacterized protein (DUF2252 family)